MCDNPKTTGAQYLDQIIDLREHDNLMLQVSLGRTHLLIGSGALDQFKTV